MATPSQVALLPHAGYSTNDTTECAVLGISLEPQRGVHAIGTDIREDFQTRFGELSFKPPGMDVFSESSEGGEYLLVRTTMTGFAPALRRPQWLAGTRTLALALRLRAALICGADQEELSGMAEAFLCCAWDDEVRAEVPTKRLRQRYDLVLRVIDQGLETERPADLRLENLASVAGESTFRFLRGFTRAMGMTPHAYVGERRLQIARGMIRKSGASLAEVASAAGYASQSHMGSNFRNALGITPATWRRSILSSVVRSI